MTTDTVHLRTIAYARSGDKGSSVNVAVIAYCDTGYQFLQEYLTDDKVHEYFAMLKQTKTVRYELPNLFALNFVLHDALAGGGSVNLRTDAQGKALGQAILEMEIQIPTMILSRCKKIDGGG